jgi:hypothetical protein
MVNDRVAVDEAAAPDCRPHFGPQSGVRPLTGRLVNVGRSIDCDLHAKSVLKADPVAV